MACEIFEAHRNVGKRIDVQGMDNAWNVPEHRQKNVDEQIAPATPFEEDTQWRE